MVDCFVSNKLNIYLECLCYVVKIVFVLHLWQTLGLGLCNRKVDRLQKETLAVVRKPHLSTLINHHCLVESKEGLSEPLKGVSLCLVVKMCKAT